MTDLRSKFFAKACMILIAGLFLFQFPRYHPGSDVFENGFSSDTAIPILMINADYFSPFSLYYWGQDRFGSWPFLIFRAIGRVFSIHWSAVAVAAGMYLFVHLCMLAYFWSARNGAWELLAGYAILHFWPGVATFIFDLSQPYGWQLGSLFLCFRAADGLYTGRSKKWISLILFAIFAFLSIWLSPSSVIYAGFYAISGFGRNYQKPLQAFAAAGLVIVAYLLHSALRNSVLGFNETHFLYTFETPLEWDISGISLALPHLSKSISTWEILVWGLGMVLLASGFSYEQFHLRKRPATVWSWAAASIVFLVAICALNWFALNQFAPRYVAVPRLMFPLSLVVYASRLDYPARLRRNRGFVAALPLALLAVLFLPHSRISKSFLLRSKEASYLETRYPGIPLVGSYWNTYVYASLQSGAGNLPQPGIGQYRRTPFLMPQILAAHQLLVNHNSFSLYLKNGEPVESLRFGGQRYILEGPRIKFENLDLSLYRKK
ncbi:MAG: hypothetical protein KDK33_08815 [Leptospiraceae bacterium]|nr:hypothetical protein [Leptospiraceae bacterium]